MHQFNLYGYPQIARALGKDPKEWEPGRAPIRINLVRLKTRTNFYSFLPKKCLELLKDWLTLRQDFTGAEIKIRNEDGTELSDPIFVTSYKKPVHEALVAEIIRNSSFKSGVQQRVPGTRRYRIHGHEFGDTFRTTCKIAGVDGAVTEFFIGHSIDKLGYDKSPWVYPEHFRKQYQLVEPYRVKIPTPENNYKTCTAHMTIIKQSSSDYLLLRSFRVFSLNFHTV